MNRFDAIHRIRENLRQGGLSIGSWIQIPHASVAEIMGRAGYDWVAVDMEHGAVSVHQLPDLFRALELGGTLPLARLAEGTARDCKQALDGGAGGVILPNVAGAEQLVAIRNHCCWPPAGSRGVGFSRANLFGNSFGDYRREAQAPLLVAMIEDVRAIDNFDVMLDVAGLDAIMIGPYDLSASMGLTAQFDHPEFRSVMELVRVRAAKHNIPCGVHVVPPSPGELQARIDEGYRFLAYSMDAVMLNQVASRPDTGVDVK